MKRSHALKSLVLEAKIPESDLEQIFTIVQDGNDPAGAIANLGKKLRMKPEDVKTAFKKKFGKTPEELAKDVNIEEK